MGVFAPLPDLSEAMLALIENAPDPMIVKDLEGRFLYMNAAGLAYFGLEAGDVIGKALSDLRQEDWVFQTEASDREVLARGEPEQSEWESRDAQGRLRAYSLIKVPFRERGGEPKGLLLIFKEVSGRKEAERNLQRVESGYLSLLETSFEGLAIHDNGVLLEANEGLARMFGYSLEELIGLNALTFALPEHREQILHHMRTGYDKPYEVEGRRRDGSPLHVELLGQSYLYQGRWVRVAAFREITERKQYEEALKQQNEKLKELDRLKNGFISSVSHELRTPLASIMGYAEFLEDEVAGGLNPDQQLFVRQIADGARRLQLLMDDLLDFARFDSGAFRIHPREADLLEKVQEIADSLQPQAHESGLRLEVQMPVEPLLLAFDPERIGQVLLNLLGNAIKFTPRGGEVRISVLPEPEAVRVEVMDSGIGIAADNLPKLFQKFFQIDPSTTREKGGAGLGLSISKALIEAHGGRIGVESRFGVGSTFWFALPLALVTTPAMINGD